MRITRKRFEAAVGRPPEDDDIARCNCPFAGMVGHSMCGWNQTLNMPNFMVSPEEAARDFAMNNNVVK